MYTRCSACHTVHPLNAALLAQGAGKYRCGKCNKLNNALTALFDEWPDAGSTSPPETTPPTLGLILDLSPVDSAKDEAEHSDHQDHGGRGRDRFSGATWMAIALVLMVVTALNLTWYFRAPLLNSPLVLENPLVHDRLVQLGLVETPIVEPGRDLEQLQLISSDLRSHPANRGALRLSATIVNRATWRQAYPQLEVLLLDSDGQAIARRLFNPSEYLAKDADIQGGMTPQAHLPLVLDLSDPGRQAVGFEIRIR